MTVKPESKPVIIPEPFSGEDSWEDWIAQFDSIAEISHWKDKQKLMRLKVRLAGRALMAFKKFPVTTRSSFERVMKALQDRF